MTLKEAIGVHRCDIDSKTGERLTHSDIYGRAIDLLGGLDAVAQYIPFPMDVIRRALKTDPYLNNAHPPVGCCGGVPSLQRRLLAYRRRPVVSLPRARHQEHELFGGRVRFEGDRSAAGCPRGWRQWISSS